VTIGRISIDKVVKGIGFAIGPRLVLTARHVVVDAMDESDRQKVGCKVELHAADGATYDAELGTSNRRLDVASLYLGADVTTWFKEARPQDGVGWRVESRPSADDPMLTGHITTFERPLVTETGEEAVLMQLHVEQSLGDYSGYSGSPVQYLTAEGEPTGFIGILIEQGRWRINTPGMRLPPVSNVLYAVPIHSALEMLGIESATEPDPELKRYKQYKKWMKRLKVVEAEPEADKSLLREAEKEVLFRYVFGE